MSDSDDDIPTLSAHTLAALQEFYNETKTGPAPSTTTGDQFAVGAVEEDWVSLLKRQNNPHRFCSVIYLVVEHKVR